MDNKTVFRKAASALLHPLSLASILLLLINDHILRIYWPSWATGKLGDFAWLFFFPLAMTVLFAFIIPSRMGRLKDLPALAAFCLGGGVFILGKTMPGFHRLLVDAPAALLGAPLSLLLDPSDLIALPAMLLSWQLYRRIPAQPTLRLKPIWIVIPVAAFLSIANSVPVRETGITWLKYQDGNVYSGNNVEYGSALVACSPDGGENWRCPQAAFQGIAAPVEDYCNFSGTRQESKLTEWNTIEVPSQPGTILRYKPNADIEISMDGGETWQSEFTPARVSEVRYAYYLKDWGGDVCVIDTPITAVADPDTGNIIFAMGLEGVLVRRADGTYRPVAVDHFEPLNLGQPGIAWKVLNGEIWLAVLLGGLVVATLGLQWRRDWFMWIAIAVLWIGWASIALLIRPAMISGDEVVFFIIASIGIGLLILPFTVNAFYVCALFSRESMRQLVFAWLGCAALYIIPFLLWYQVVLPLYYLAVGFGILLCAGFLVWRWLSLRSRIEDAFSKMTSAVQSGKRLQIIGGLLIVSGIILIPLSYLVIDVLSFVEINIYLIGLLLVAGYVQLLTGWIRFWQAVKKVK